MEVQIQLGRKKKAGSKMTQERKKKVMVHKQKQRNSTTNFEEIEALDERDWTHGRGL